MFLIYSNSSYFRGSVKCKIISSNFCGGKITWSGRLHDKLDTSSPIICELSGLKRSSWRAHTWPL